MKFWKKILFGITLTSAFAGITIAASAPIYAEGEETPIAETPEEVTPAEEEKVEAVEKPCKVVIDKIEGGTVNTNVADGEVGDVVTISFDEHFLYTLKGIYVNGKLITANEEGKYQFALVEGENKITASFEVDDAKVKEVAKLIEGVRSGDWSRLLTVENLFKLIYFIVTFLLSSGLLAAFIKSKKYKVKTMDDIEFVVKSETGVVITDLVNNTLKPILDILLDKEKSTEDKINTLTRALIASISADETSKIAILKDLQNTVELKDKALTEQVQAIVEKQLESKQVAKQETQTALEEIKKETNNLEAPHL